MDEVIAVQLIFCNLKRFLSKYLFARWVDSLNDYHSEAIYLAAIDTRYGIGVI